MAICFSWNELTLPRSVTSPALTSTDSRRRLDRFVSANCIETWLARRRSAVVSGPAAAIIVGSFFLFSAIMHKRPRLCGFILGARGTLLQCGLPGFAGANANRVGNRINENLAVADLAGLGRFHDDVNDLVAGLVGHHDLNLKLGHKINAIFRAAIGFLLSLLSAEAADLRDRHAVKAGTDQGIFDSINLVMTNNGFNLEHAGNSG